MSPSPTGADAGDGDGDDGAPMAPPPRVTVVIPTKDRFSTLRTTVSCVLAQRGVDVDVVVVDDGGSDGTTARLAGRDARVRVVRHASSAGVSQARNTGLAEARTPWVAFVDDDDLWAPHKLAAQLRALETDPACRWACSSAAVFTSDGKVRGIHPVPEHRDVSITLLRENVVPGGGSGVLADTALLQQVGGFDRSLSNLADWDCWLRLAQHSPVARVHSVDVGYRRNRTSMAAAVHRSEQELERMRATYAELYRSAGVDVDWLPWLWYLHGVTYSSGDWTAGTRRSWHLFRQHGLTKALLQPVKYAVPGVVHWRDTRRSARLQPAEHAAASAWLKCALAP